MKAQNTAKPTTVREHIRELQKRLFICALSLIAGGCLIFVFYQPILKFLSSPLGSSLYYSNPAGGFAFIMKICFAGALIFTIPVLIYNIIMFTRPAFQQSLPMKRILLTTLGSTLLAICGAAFAYIVILPGSLSFFQGFQVDGLKALISADDYLSFVTNIIITFVIVFQIPLVISFIDKIKPLKPKKLLKFEKWVILGSLILALVLPFTYEFFTSLMIAVPIIALYNLSIIIVLMQHARENRMARRQVIQPAKIEAELNLNELVIDDFVEDLVPSQKPVIVNLPATQTIPVSVIEPIVQAQPALARPRLSMDFGPSRQQAKVEIPEWVKQRKMRQMAANSSTVRVFSDIRPRQRTNLSLASQ